MGTFSARWSWCARATVCASWALRADTEVQALGVGEHSPDGLFLGHLGHDTGAKLDEALDLGLGVGNPKVEMHRRLRAEGLRRDPLNEQ